MKFSKKIAAFSEYMNFNQSDCFDESNKMYCLDESNKMQKSKNISDSLAEKFMKIQNWEFVKPCSEQFKVFIIFLIENMVSSE